MPSIGGTYVSRQVKKKIKHRIVFHSRIDKHKNLFNGQHINNNLVPRPSPFHPRDNVGCSREDTCDFEQERSRESDIIDLTTFPTTVSSESHCLSNKTTAVTHREEPEVNILDKLRDWAIKYRVSGKAVSGLLKTLKKHQCFINYPTDSRTLLRTPRQINTYEVPPGEYCHFPIAQALQNIRGIDSIDDLELQINIDGLPLANSSSQQFWPILAHPFSHQSPPIVLGVYFGLEKPKSSNSLLRMVVDDLLNAVTNPPVVNGRIKNVSVHSIVCDAPARAFVLNVKGHTGYFACTKCCVEGEHYSHRMTFSEINCELRTNDSFRNQTCEDHHLINEPCSELLRLPIDIVKQVPLDYQHLICLGVVRKLLNLWVKGKASYYKLSSAQITELTKSIVRLKPYVSSDFNRKPRGLTHLSNWKATEYRTFLLYIGPTALRGILQEPYYNHFICLHVAVTALCSPSLHAAQLEYAGALLRYFVETFPMLYGLENVSYNVHNLIHLCSDSANFGVLDNFSTFRFENYLGKLKRLIVSGNRPLQQIYNRIVETTLAERKHNTLNAAANSFQLSTSLGDNVCILKSGETIIIEEILEDQSTLIGKKLVSTGPLYSTPCDSSIIGISCFDSITTSEQIVTNYSEVTAKALLFPVNQRFVAYPLLHTL